MRPSVRRIEELYEGQIDFHVLDVDLPSTRDLSIKYSVNGIPYIVLLDAEGRLFEALLGYQTEDQLIDAIELLLEASGD